MCGRFLGACRFQIERFRDDSISETKVNQGRSASSRNLLGGFLGGVLGILALGYFTQSVLMLTLGVVTGVVGGYWYEEIGKALVVAFQDAVATVRAPQVAVKKVQGPMLSCLPARFGKSMKLVLKTCTFITFVSGALMSICGLKNAEQVMIFSLLLAACLLGWYTIDELKDSFRKRFMFLEALAVITLLVVLLAVVISTMLAHLNQEGLLFPILLFLVLASFCLIALTLYSLHDCGYRKKRLKRLKEGGALRYFFWKFSTALYLVMVMLLYVTTTLFSLLIVTSGIYLLVGLPLVLSLCFTKALCAIVLRRGHWLALTVTLLLTAICGYYFTQQGWLDGSRKNILAALLVGTISAGLTEAIGFALAKFCMRLSDQPLTFGSFVSSKCSLALAKSGAWRQRLFQRYDSLVSREF